ncbi:MAG: type II toxin-antitoxin system VapC family toxin [Thermoplasmatales archaeon]|jgi:predicted nucleic acid-binding protein|nr:type II toxin-antitoxin system VapC family toxin [Thermoplasmatales archaeon]
MVLLDTNVIIDYLIGKEKIVKLVNTFPGDELSMTFVNQYELLKYKNRKALEEAIDNLRIYHSTDLSINSSAKAYKSLSSKGKMMSDNDLLMFGVCIANNEVMITQDKAFKDLGSESVIVIE